MPQGKTRIDLMASALRQVMEQGETPSKEPAKPTPAPRSYQTLSPDLVAALLRLHGSGAKLSSNREAPNGTVDEQALAMRPRAANWGKDIPLAKGGK